MSKTEIEEKFAKLEFSSFTSVVFTICSFFFYAFITMTLWRWFAVPLGAPKVTLFQAAGVDLLAGWLTHQIVPVKSEYSGDAMRIINLVRSLIVLATGFVISLCMG